MQREHLSCIYCSNDVDPSNGAGDHIIPAALGEFRDDVHFRPICPACNHKIGASEAQMLRCGPERLFRDLVVPATSRSQGRRLGWQGAEGAPPPQIHAVTSTGTWVAAPASNPGDMTAVDQVVITDAGGVEHFVRLHPGMTAAALRSKVSALGVTVAHVRCSWDEAHEASYLAILRQAWPDMHYEALSVTEPGSQTVQSRIRLQVNDHYFRAVAKMAFHYYLVRSIRAHGDEPGFSELRAFILGGGDPKPFFTGPPRIVDPDRRSCFRPARWHHVLAASEEPDPVCGYVCLFKGPRSPGIEHHVALGKLGSRLALPKPVWAHVYEYDLAVPPTGKVGTVKSVTLTRVR